MIIHVTAEDIVEGVKQDCSRCPVALAIRRAAGAASVDVSAAPGPRISPIQWETEIYLSARLVPSIQIALPGAVVARIEAYDATGVMEPFEFELETEAGTLPYTGGER